MIEAVRNSYYYRLKRDFFEGMNRSLPSCCKKPEVVEADADAVKKISSAILYDALSIQMHAAIKKLPRVGIIYPSNDAVAEIITQRNKENEEQRRVRMVHNMVTDTMNRGRTTPLECMAAWYDALAEYAAAQAYEKVDQAPIPAINEELNKLEKRLSVDEGYAIAKEELINSIKRLFPTEYEYFLAECQESFTDKIDETVDDIVDQITGKSKSSIPVEE